MIFYPNQSTNQFTRGIGLNAVVTTAVMKAGDYLTLDVIFHNGLSGEDLPEGSSFVFVLKDGYGAGAVTYAIALADAWTKEGGGHYRASLNLSTEPLIGAIDEKATIKALGELSWSSDGVHWESSNVLSVTVQNQVYVGTEGTPLSLPSPDEWLGDRRPAPLILTDVPIDGTSGVARVVTWEFTGNVLPDSTYGIDSYGFSFTADPSGDPETLVQYVAGDTEGQAAAFHAWLLERIEVGGSPFSLLNASQCTVVGSTVTFVFKEGAVANSVSLNEGDLGISETVVTAGSDVAEAGTAGKVGQLAIVTLDEDADRTYAFVCTHENPVRWSGVTSGLFRSPAEGGWRIFRMSGPDSGYSLFPHEL